MRIGEGHYSARALEESKGAADILFDTPFFASSHRTCKGV